MVNVRMCPRRGLAPRQSDLLHAMHSRPHCEHHPRCEAADPRHPALAAIAPGSGETPTAVVAIMTASPRAKRSRPRLTAGARALAKGRAFHRSSARTTNSREQPQTLQTPVPGHPAQARGDGQRPTPASCNRTCPRPDATWCVGTRYALRHQLRVLGACLTVHEDRLHAEVDRQLGEVRSTCDGLATRSGLLITATGVGAALVAAHIDKLRQGLTPTLWALGLASVLGIAVLSPWLITGPVPTRLQAWMSGGASATTSSQLYDVKTTLLEANLQRLTVMRTFFSLQVLATTVAVGLALWYSAGK